MTIAASPGTQADRRRGIALDLAIALGLALILSIGWTINDWARLSRMLLPDPDDMMRLAQVRDWLAGQGINDWTQYRMAPPSGSPMHWSRVNDFGIAGLILAATPLVGRPNAELFTILSYPALLFACALFLSAQIGRRLWQPGGGPVAAVLTALAYPGTTVFIPGRIDHHALQVVLIQLLVLALMRAPGLTAGILAGAVTGISLVVGLETAPQIATLIGVMAGLWLMRGDGERPRIAGFAGSLLLSTLFFLVFLRPTLWTTAYCDAFTPASSTAALLIAVAFGALATLSPWLQNWRIRLAVGGAFGAALIAIIVIAYPSCINGPYGAMDPFLLRAFIPHIDEANGIFMQPRIARIFALGGVVATACLTVAWAITRNRTRWTLLLPLSAVILVSALIMLFQIRGAYIGAPLAAPLLAGLVVKARQRARWQLPAIIVAWLAGSGMAYAEIAEHLELSFSREIAGINRPTFHVVCSARDTWKQIDRLPPGVTMAGTSVAAYLLGATHHSTIGAGYHRNDTGNMAMYRFFLSPPNRSQMIAHHWRTDYVAFCPGDFSEIEVMSTFPNSLAAQLQSGRVPAWLAPVPISSTPLKFYRVVR